MDAGAKEPCDCCLKRKGLFSLQGRCLASMYERSSWHDFLGARGRKSSGRSLSPINWATTLGARRLDSGSPEKAACGTAAMDDRINAPSLALDLVAIAERCDL
jgi:hypothetical protein